MIGKVLGNRYEIIEKIGGGGMAIVYKARCRLLNRFVAVKILRHELTEDREFISRFNVESQAAASLSHPNIVSVYDVGQQDDIYYIVMEYIDGITLKELINKNGALPWKDALNFSIQICSALEHAHKKHIVHRDIKPHNIMITKDGMVKVTDFGIARAATSTTVTLGGNTIGSVHYFSPEQARGGYTDEKSDIYSLGVVMYELLTGRVPFDGESPVAVAIKHIQEEPIPPRNINKNIPVALQAIVLKAISKEQSSRYLSAAAMLKDLYRAFDEPDIDFVSGISIDDYPTQKVPIIPVNGSDEMGKTKKKTKKEDKVAVIAAIFTSLILIGLITFLGYGFLNGRFSASENEHPVPNLIGKDFDTIKSIYNDPEKITVVEVRQEFNDEVEKGKIISQDPSPNTMIKYPQTIEVVVSKGPKTVKVPDLTNKEYRQAEIELERKDLSYRVTYEYHDTIPEGIVIRHIPEAGVEVKVGETVHLFVSQGREIKMVKVDNYVGKTEDEAKRMIGQAGLVVGDITTEVNERPKGTVISQSIPAGQEVEEKTVIDLVVSEGKPTDEKERYININLPQDRETVRVRVDTISAQGSKTVYDQVHSKDDSPVTVKLTGRGTITVQVYFDGELKAEDTINFEG
ncbi:MAG: Stk1 family PASTA domain-containing Ser/Thr kinase [Clostridiaceae bacterium]|nr:Stk1 family PASTA domain-containing Ser/Thr kinase [Clostridiaceae bacterium]